MVGRVCATFHHYPPDPPNLCWIYLQVLIGVGSFCLLLLFVAAIVFTSL